MLGALKLIMNSADLAILFVSIYYPEEKKNHEILRGFTLAITRSMFLHNPICDKTEF